MSAKILQFGNPSRDQFDAIYGVLAGQGMLSKGLEAISTKIRIYLENPSQGDEVKAHIIEEISVLLQVEDELFFTSKFLELILPLGLFSPENLEAFKASLNPNYQKYSAKVDDLVINMRSELMRLMAILEKYSETLMQATRIEEFLQVAESAEHFAIRTNALYALTLLAPNLSDDLRLETLARVGKLATNHPMILQAQHDAIIALQSKKVNN